MKTLYYFCILFGAIPLVTFGRADPSKVVGPQSCSACHGPECSSWQQTHHSKTFDLLHRLPKTKEIAEKMGVSKIKNEGECMTCHYTPQKLGATTKVIAGISCESCH